MGLEVRKGYLFPATVFVNCFLLHFIFSIFIALISMISSVIRKTFLDHLVGSKAGERYRRNRSIDNIGSALSAVP